ncbi:hypothetical protein LF41_2409 [Lysobacter dokdonensis DS-58]|uniref:Transmembrane protein n=1 Tax=Lysobacter dokdonensis DS-58 TaxID=1300345 RepID=A0A0A2WMD8_9GAMM|nr:hypothetical protein [Lysobacter dokdonensis]KGQ19902.1 hypothetical protein LF41_2409 [Lysobacter dokdonensis DS-58]
MIVFLLTVGILGGAWLWTTKHRRYALPFALTFVGPPLFGYALVWLFWAQ